MLTMKLNDHEDHAEWDWLVLENGRVIQGFATSTGAERWIADREQMIADKLVSQAQARRAARDATRDPVTKRLP